MRFFSDWRISVLRFDQPSGFASELVCTAFELIEGINLLHGRHARVLTRVPEPVRGRLNDWKKQSRMLEHSLLNVIDFSSRLDEVRAPAQIMVDFASLGSVARSICGNLHYPWPIGTDQETHSDETPDELRVNPAQAISVFLEFSKAREAHFLLEGGLCYESEG